MATVPSIQSRARVPSPPRAGAVRGRILEEHRQLRHRLDLLERMVDGLQEDPRRCGSVNRAARDVLRLLIAHTQLEDSILVPVLQTLDAWGEVRADQLLSHHVQQRAELQALIQSYARPSGDLEELAVRTLAWIADVRSDMASEECGILSQEHLDDERIAIDGEAG